MKILMTDYGRVKGLHHTLQADGMFSDQKFIINADVKSRNWCQI